MSDYWVKPTVDQLRAELEWECAQAVVRKKRRRTWSILAAAIAVLVIGGTWIIPRSAQPGYAMEEQTAATIEETEAESQTAAPEPTQSDNAVVSGK